MSFDENFITDFLKKEHNIEFNIQQKEAIAKTNGNTLLLAVAGSGKTTVMVTRIAKLIHSLNVPASSILTLTFSVSSARDMKKKYLSLFGNLGGEIPSFSTIHSFCYSVLKRYTNLKGSVMPTLLNSSKGKLSQAFILRQIYKKVNSEAISEDTLSSLSSDIGYIKNMCIKSEDQIKSYSDIDGFLEIYQSYEKYKLENKLMDFDDMLNYALTALKRYPKLLEEFFEKARYINVDETQDTSLLQHQIIKLINKKYQNLFMVGDEDQSIYSFRGAYPEALLNFEKEFDGGTVLKMEENFRSKTEIIECANRFISQNKNRYNKKMIVSSQNQTSEKCVFPIELDCQELQYSKIAEIINSYGKNKTVGILYRNNHSAIAVCEYLDRHKIDFKIREHKSFFSTSAVIKDMIAFFELALNGGDFKAFSSVFYKTSFKLKRSLIDAYSLDNLGGDDIFSVLYERVFDDNQSTAKKVYCLKKLFSELKSKRPFEAVDFILNDIGYLEYLRYKNSFKSYSYCLQKLTVLKNLIIDCKNLKEALYKIDSIEEIINAHIESKSNITLSTAHSAKGLEFDVVIVIDLFEGVFPSVSAISSFESNYEEEMEEEARLFYVCVTRAKEKLFLLSAEKSCGDFMSSSRFIERLFNVSKKSSISTGTKIEHFIFGKGSVTKIFPKENCISAFFGLYGERKLSLDIMGTNKLKILK